MSKVSDNLRKIILLSGVKHREIALRAGMSRPSITRMLSGRHSPKVDTLLLVLAAINEIAQTDYGLGDLGK